MAMRCQDLEARVTAYLDGDLDAATASALRGHLRGCASCRHLAEDHAKLAGALAALPPDEPPPQLWDGVLARLADAETADAERSRWGLVLRRAWFGLRAHLLPVAAVAAAATVALVWAVKPTEDTTIAVAPAAQPAPAPAPAPPPPVQIAARDHRDVDTAIALEAQRIDQEYTDVVSELSGDVDEERPTWSAAQRRAFDAEVTRLRAAVDAQQVPAHTADEDPFDAREADTAHREQRERAWQRLVAYLQRAAIGELEEARR